MFDMTYNPTICNSLHCILFWERTTGALVTNKSSLKESVRSTYFIFNPITGPETGCRGKIELPICRCSNIDVYRYKHECRTGYDER